MSNTDTFTYKTWRCNFGRKMETECVSKATISIAPNPDLRKNFDVVDPFYVGTQTAVTNSGHQINTEVTLIQQEQILHTQGSWPAKTDITDPSSCKNQRTKIDKWPNIAKEIKELAQTAEKTAKLNFSLDIFSDHFKHDEQQTVIQEPSIRTLSILRDKYTDRYVSSLSWSDLTQTKRVAVCYTPNDVSNPTAHYESFIYNIESLSLPEMELHPPSPLVCLEYNIKDNNFLVGGMAHGSLSLWDVRNGSLPIWTSAIESSHRGPVNAVKWISSKTAFECISTSTDGTTMLWDTRNGTKPLEVIEMQPNKDMLPEGFNPPYGGIVIDYHTGVPTKYMVGTIEGLVFNVNRKASDPSQRISNVYYSHYGPVYSLHRHPTEAKYFLTASDWSVRVYTEDNKTPLINLPAQPHYITSALWGHGRSSVIFTGDATGGVQAWDLTQSLCEPVCSLQVADSSIYTMAIEASGEYIMTGSSNGTATLLQLNDALKNPLNPNEKQTFNGMLSREAKRVKNYDQFLKEQKMREKKGKTQQAEEKKEDEIPFDPTETEAEFERALAGKFDEVVEQVRVVIGGDEEEDAKPKSTPPPQPDTSISGTIKEGIAGDEKHGEEEAKKEEQPAEVEERSLPQEEEKKEEGGVLGGLIQDAIQDAHEEKKEQEEAKQEEEQHKEEEAKHEDEQHKEEETKKEEEHHNEEENKHEEDKHNEEEQKKEEAGPLGDIIQDAIQDAQEEKKEQEEEQHHEEEQKKEEEQHHEEEQHKEEEAKHEEEKHQEEETKKEEEQPQVEERELPQEEEKKEESGGPLGDLIQDAIQDAQEEKKEEEAKQEEEQHHEEEQKKEEGGGLLGGLIQESIQDAQEEKKEEEAKQEEEKHHEEEQKNEGGGGLLGGLMKKVMDDK